MIDTTIKLLALTKGDFKSPSVDIARGKYELTEEDKQVTIKSILRWLKR